MENQPVQAAEAGEFVIIGNVKAPVKVWDLARSYKSRERGRGRRVNLPDALCELAEIGAKAEGIEPTIK